MVSSVTASVEFAHVPAIAEDPKRERAAAGAAVLSMRGITKRFGALTALDDMSLEVRAGEVHCLLGENGAGKSTLCHVIFGVHRADAGVIELCGERFQPRDPAHALQAGVAMVHQHFSLVGNMTALENLALAGATAGKRRPWRLDATSIEARVEVLAQQFGLTVPLRRRVETLSVGEQQRVEVLKCLLERPRLLVLDEPTAVLPPPEVAGLLEICRRVARDGCGVVLVTHKLSEIGAIADVTTVMRRGRGVTTVSMANADLGALVRAMVGHDVPSIEVAQSAVTAGARAEGVAAKPSGTAPRADALRLEGVTWRDPSGVVRLDIAFAIRRGEIVGLAGVEGNGQSELGAILAGLRRPESGRVLVDGQDVTRLSPRALTARGIGIVPEDRHQVGCHLDLSVSENLFLGQLARFSPFGLLARRALRHAAEERLTAFDVRGGPDDRFGDLSGGNQQKVVLARELSLNPLTFLLAAQPTRGLDIGAVQAVYREIQRARDSGTAVLLVSSELDELIAVADRILVLYRGRIVGEVPARREHQERLGRLMSGHSFEGAGAA